ncbi:MAG: hypothetical protein MUC88_00265 [Planctomycetes bacterium]|nr:hypothetical protein [Planctomycetota bacterium]
MKDALRKPTWYKMTQLFDGVAKRIAEVGEHNILVRGVRYAASIKCQQCGHRIHLNNLRVGAQGDQLDLSPELAICVVPMGLPDAMGEDLRRMSEANLRMPVLLVTSNVHYVQLRPLHVAEAKRLMTEGVEHAEQREAGQGSQTPGGGPALA